MRDVAAMDRLAGVLLHVNADGCARCPMRAAGGERAVELRDLIALRQVGVEVVLAREDRALVHGAAGGEAARMASSTARAIQHRQRSGIAEADRADLRVRSARRTTVGQPQKIFVAVERCA